MELFDLPLIWAFIIGFGIIMYVLMDGFDLGVYYRFRHYYVCADGRV